MKILALETSTQAGSVALLDDDILTERPVIGRPGHSETLLPETVALLRDCGVSLAEVDAIAFGAGPGAFTGLRLACGVAQGLALGAGKPVLPISNLEALASQCPGDAVFVAIDARMSEVYFAAYRRRDGDLVEVLAPGCAPPDVVHLPAEGDWAGFGSAFQAYREVLVDGLGARLVCFDGAPQAQAGAIARVAAGRFLRGEGIDPVLAAPLYVRNKVALTTEERLARGGRA
ncbi:tRNA (adenosine(37)-N6)-threonylcarbamoyltransferase complex dimerization subunit type 1 TsaB [Zoogloea dura]|uniref:tRNA (Adenosine(37)-N6)-threonylcarbamoyltransferase complex dimerization subunit type 1 TsaB n=1 Tax=Zoogloea dura TaxID=2728840 RepID=A0A848G0N1_9RHOO|nr:tRNA (adenosine(37)-N6)-threonylcarbamoyltransferase complex dimerization subunit type 1 TsaB [Zoogloea dura]NML24679.1 tRNA (adenosine(37)-N6)-threonylcarbamoyltransferase complex dimerization subunit type 1 TsaB [Zoogloea dura]